MLSTIVLEKHIQNTLIYMVNLYFYLAEWKHLTNILIFNPDFDLPVKWSNLSAIGWCSFCSVDTLNTTGGLCDNRCHHLPCVAETAPSSLHNPLRTAGHHDLHNQKEQTSYQEGDTSSAQVFAHPTSKSTESADSSSTPFCSTLASCQTRL